MIAEIFVNIFINPFSSSKSTEGVGESNCQCYLKELKSITLSWLSTLKQPGLLN